MSETPTVRAPRPHPTQLEVRKDRQQGTLNSDGGGGGIRKEATQCAQNDSLGEREVL